MLGSSLSEMSSLTISKLENQRSFDIFLMIQLEILTGLVPAATCTANCYHALTRRSAEHSQRWAVTSSRASSTVGTDSKSYIQIERD